MRGLRAVYGLEHCSPKPKVARSNRAGRMTYSHLRCSQPFAIRANTQDSAANVRKNVRNSYQ